MLLDSGRVVLTTQNTHSYNFDEMTSYICQGHDIDQNVQFGSVFCLNRAKAKESKYYPLSMEGHFESDRYTHFIRCGFKIDQDAIIVKRAPIDNDIPTNFLYSFDMHLGVVHQTNMIEDPEDKDRKLRLLQFMSADRWDNMLLGYKHNYNPKSPRKYKK